MTDCIPFCVVPGWIESVFVKGAYETYRILFYANGTARFEHRCDRGDRGVIICAPLLQHGIVHTKGEPGRLTISPSIFCPDCGTHGFVRNGRWVES